jgi:hypothetical protein
MSAGMSIAAGEEQAFEEYELGHALPEESMFTSILLVALYHCDVRI